MLTPSLPQPAGAGSCWTRLCTCPLAVNQPTPLVDDSVKVDGPVHPTPAAHAGHRSPDRTVLGRRPGRRTGDPTLPRLRALHPPPSAGVPALPVDGPRARAGVGSGDGVQLHRDASGLPSLQ